MFPALALLGGIGANYHASNRDLLPLTDGRAAGNSQFWMGVSMGAILGLWFGTNYGSKIMTFYNYVDSAWCYMTGSEKKNKEDDSQGGKRFSDLRLF